jgi:hypothetical protein
LLRGLVVTRPPHWNYLDSLLTWAIASGGFVYTQSQHTTGPQSALVFMACVVVAALVNFGIHTVRTRNRAR